MPANRKLKAARGNVFSDRVRAFVNDRFGGNISKAAAELKCDYGALYHTVNGARKKPNLVLAATIATFTETTIDQWVRP